MFNVLISPNLFLFISITNNEWTKGWVMCQFFMIRNRAQKHPVHKISFLLRCKNCILEIKNQWMPYKNYFSSYKLERVDISYCRWRYNMIYIFCGLGRKMILAVLKREKKCIPFVIMLRRECVDEISDQNMEFYINIDSLY